MLTVNSDKPIVQQLNTKNQNGTCSIVDSSHLNSSSKVHKNVMPQEAVGSPKKNMNGESEAETPPTFGELLKLWKAKRGKKCSYYKNSSGGRASFLDTLEAVYPLLDSHLERPLYKLRKAHILEVRDQLIEEDKSAATINKYICAIKTILRFGSERICTRTDEEYVDFKTMAKIDQIRPLKEGEKNVKITAKVRAVSREDVLKVAQGMKSPHREFVTILLITGMRSGELLQMKPSEIDYESYKDEGCWLYTPKLHKTTAKGIERNIFLNREVQEMLKREIPDPKSNLDLPYFHHNYRGQIKGYCQKAMNKTIKSKAKALGIKPFNLHQIRHTFITEVQDSDSLETAAMLAGHSQDTAEKHYAEAPTKKLIRTANNRTAKLDQGSKTPQVVEPSQSNGVSIPENLSKEDLTQLVQIALKMMQTVE